MQAGLVTGVVPFFRGVVYCVMQDIVQMGRSRRRGTSEYFLGLLSPIQLRSGSCISRD